MIRLASIAPRFKHGGAGGLDLTRTWSEFKSLTDVQRDILRHRHGRWIRVHPDDREQLAKLGLRFVNGLDPLELLAKPTTPTTTDKTTSNAKADKADEKKKA